MVADISLDWSWINNENLRISNYNSSFLIAIIYYLRYIFYIQIQIPYLLYLAT